MNRDVPSKNVIFDMQIDGIYYPVFCAQSLQHVLEQDEIETTHINSGPNRDYVPGMSNSTVTASGLTRIDNTDSRISIFYLMQQSVRRQIWPLRIRATDQDSPASTISVTFNGFIKSTSYDKNIPSLSKCFVTFRVSGGLEFSDIIAPPAEPECEVEDPLYIDAVETETSVSHANLTAAGVEILKVARSGIGYTPTTGTPTGMQYKFTAGTGTIEFDAAIPFNAGEVIYILYKIEA